MACFLGRRGAAAALAAAVGLVLPTSAGSLHILAYAKPVCAASHQLAVRRAAEALADAGHDVVLLEPASAASKAWVTSNASDLGRSGSLEVLRITGLMSDDEFSARFQAGDSFQRLAQEVNDQLLPWALPRLRSRERPFDLAVVDALYPVLARELRLPSVHLQCSSDPDAMSAAWFHYGFSAAGGGGFDAARATEVAKHLRFVMLWLASWMFVGSHQDTRVIPGDSSLLWGAYYRYYVRALLFQGSDHFALPRQAASLVSAYGSTVGFVGSLTSRPTAKPPEEDIAVPAGSAGLALVAFGTKPNPCPWAILQALAQHNLTGIVLVEDCRGRAEEVTLLGHVLPQSRDQGAWLKAPSLRLAVVHGGIHSLLEAASAGMPVACVPHEGDQSNNCRELQRQHLGWAMPRTAEVQEAHEVIRLLLGHGDESGRLERVKAAAESLQAAGGPAAVVRWVQQLAPSLKRRSIGPPPFFAAPLEWAEGWALILPAGLALFSCLMAVSQRLLSDPSEHAKTD